MTESSNNESSGYKDGICKREQSEEEGCQMFTLYGCNIIDNTCKCSREESCINPFEYLFKEDCFAGLRSGEFQKYYS